MLRFMMTRLVGVVLLLFVLSFVIYGLMGLMPGDPIDMMIAGDPNLSPDDAVRLKALYGLDKSLYVRYFNWLGAVFSGDFGYSRFYEQPALGVLLPRLFNTLYLVGGSLFLSIILSIFFGSVAARHPRGFLDSVLNGFSFAGISIPPFWLAMMLILFFAVKLGWLPSGGVAPAGVEVTLFLRLKYLILPVSCLTILSMGEFIRFIRAGVLEELRLDYIRTARAKGLSHWRVIYRHALRNALIPSVTVFALSLGAVFSGALITEMVFGYQGMGKLIFDAINGNDYNLAMLGLMLAAAMVVLANILADILYVMLDPRVKFG